MLCSSTADLYTHISNTYVLTCFFYPRPLSYYTNVHIQLVDVYNAHGIHTSSQYSPLPRSSSGLPDKNG